jgi:GT2 family glycosyltransferase
MSLAPAVTVIIPTKNRRTELLTAFRSLIQQTTTPAQIVIVDQSTDDSVLRCLQAELCDGRYVRLDYVHNRSMTGAASARNCAMDLAIGDVWLFLDDDVELERDFIMRLLEAYEKCPDAGGISGIIVNYSMPSFVARWWARIFARGPFHDDRQPIYWACDKLRNAAPIKVKKFTSALMSFRSSVIRHARFDSNYPGALAEDEDFCYRLPTGTLMFIAPQARLVHNRSPANRAKNHWLRFHAEASSYLYERHWKNGLANRMCLMWLLVGYAVAATAGSAKRGSLESWRALRAGRLAGKTVANSNRR